MNRIPLLPDRKRPLLFAHRGCSSLAPENTMAAFRKAREVGAPGIELDIHISADGQLVVAHDDSFKRTVPEGWNGDGRPIEELSWEDIKKIDVGAAFGRQSPAQDASSVPAGAYTGEHPPLIADVIEEFCPGIYIDIELKSHKKAADPLPPAFAALLSRLGDRALKSITVSSFNPFTLAAFKKLCPRVATAIIWSGDKGVPFPLRHGFGRVISRCDYLKPVHLQADKAAVARFAGKEGRPSVPWTIDDPALAQTMLDNGCEGIIGNRPQDMGGLH